VSVSRDVPSGWSQTVCLRCENAAGEYADYDNWVVTQTADCTGDVITLKPEPLEDQTITYTTDS
jgi:hypothetical protein